MRKFLLATTATTIGALMLFAADWPMQNGGPERNGWARSEHVLTKTSVKSLVKLYEHSGPDGTGALTSPIVNGNLITYRGFKEMLIFAGSGDRLFSVDADLNKLIWQAQFPYRSDKPQRQNASAACPGGLTAPVAMAGSSSGTMHFAAEAARMPATPGQRPFRRRYSPYFPPLWQSVYPMRPDTLSQLNVVYAVSSDGFLHIVNSSTGEDLIPAFQFVPPNAKVTSLNIWETMVYATTADNCDGYRNALYGVNLLTNEKRVVVFTPESGEFAGSAGTAISRDGTVFVQIVQPGEKGGEDAVLALTPRELKVRDTFSPARERLSKEEAAQKSITPIVFSWMGKEMLVAGGRNGHLYLLDAKTIGGADHHTPVFDYAPARKHGRNRGSASLEGTFSTWQNVDLQQRWIYAPAADGIHAFKLSEENGRTTLAPLWDSQSIAAPSPVVIAGGMVFTISRGPQPALYALDALTGNQIYSSGNTISGALEGGLAIANGRIYFSTNDKAVYCYGLRQENTQLAEQ